MDSSPYNNNAKILYSIAPHHENKVVADGNIRDTLIVFHESGGTMSLNILNIFPITTIVVEGLSLNTLNT
ncbi:hypothetical protein BPAE_0182g00210 [Botrytis paeoniae]|uniref:Uncharacterized protein n=1 Tax=Botrytis paeoniae TaxID=278948 RepID=A0A4Z1FHN4_9HELO|nr:hypothetical protein BPAE_0182g00210 [Botrytis paeoniae]